MHNIRLVAKHDISVTLRRRSFWILTFVLPAFMLGVQAFAAVQDYEGGNPSTTAVGNNKSPQGKHSRRH